MTQTIRVTKEGKDVLTSTNPNDFIFNSDYNTFKIIDTRTLLAQTVAADPTTITQPHGQDYIPAIMAFAKFPDGYATLPGSWNSDSFTAVGGTLRVAQWVVEIDATNMYFIFYRNGLAGYDVDIKYYIFESPAT